jgi:formate hydrogenlyase subunit 6/NADH:ubiquinone oxidoreductase subunit I
MPKIGEFVTIDTAELQYIFNFLQEAGYTLIGPTHREGAILYDEITSIGDLPQGWTDEQAAGSYRLKRRDDQAYFGYVVGPTSWKKYLYPPQRKLLSTQRQAGGTFAVTGNDEAAPKYAFIGVRGCELKAIQIQDEIFLGGAYQDPAYKARREGVFIIGVECTEPKGTCFCASMGTGPKVGPGYDLRLTEVDEIFVVKIGSEVGRQAVEQAPSWRPTGAYELQKARRAMAEAEKRMGRWLDTSNLPNLLYQNLEHPRWEKVGRRCLSCANCTQVCPTCFCSDVVEISSLDGQQAERVRVWDSCFSMDYSYVHGGNSRPKTANRYRQWLTHKLASWIDQFGMSGCTGCGRCITWCPVGIDITEEVAALGTREAQQ